MDKDGVVVMNRQGHKFLPVYKPLAPIVKDLKIEMNAYWPFLYP